MNRESHSRDSSQTYLSNLRKQNGVHSQTKLEAQNMFKNIQNSN